MTEQKKLIYNKQLLLIIHLFFTDFNFNWVIYLIYKIRDVIL